MPRRRTASVRNTPAHVNVAPRPAPTVASLNDAIDRAIEYMREDIDSDYRNCERVIASWNEDFVKDAHYAVRWSQRMIDAVSERRVLQIVIVWLDKGKSFAQIAAYLREQSENETRSPSRSSDPMSNEVARCDASAMIKTANKLQYRHDALQIMRDQRDELMMYSAMQ